MKIKKIFFLGMILACFIFLTGAGDSDILNTREYKAGTIAAEDTSQESLAGGIVRYTVPSTWKDSREAIKNIEKGNGYCYKLDSDCGDGSVEDFFIFYLDYEMNLKNPGDNKETNAVEKAVIKNICGESPLFLGKSFKSQDDKYTFDSYLTNHGKHRVQFLFTPAKNGLCVMVYVYRNKDFADQARYVVNSLQIDK